jgi:oxygen-independent coproporphyrinogen III oxidase
MSPFSLYVHLPYCARKCPYCDFNTFAVATIPERDYRAALLAELDYYASQTQWSHRPLQSIYFGGGTPSLFSPSSIGTLIDAAVHHFPVSVSLEVTLEMNPRTENSYFSGLRHAGVNRLSIGAQSFNPALLHALGRDHKAEDIERCVRAARDAGFDNISLDLMLGNPDETILEVESDIAQAVALSPDHISTYALTIEKGTPFYRSLLKGHLSVPPDDTVADMLDLVALKLPELGYERYEISNFSNLGKESKHNLAYWNGNDYLGLGAGAHSYCHHLQSLPARYANISLPTEYMEQTAATGTAVAWNNTLSIHDQIFEFFFLGLRKARGVDLKEFEQRFHLSIEQAYPGVVTHLCLGGFLELSGDLLRFTTQGFRMSDSVLEHFVPDEKMQKLPTARKKAG